MIHRIFSVKQLSDSFLNEWLKYFQSMCFIFHKTICIFMPFYDVEMAIIKK